MPHSQAHASKHLPAARRWSRRLAMQALYQWQMTGQASAEIETQFLDDDNIAKADLEYFKRLLRGTTAQGDAFEASMNEYAGRAVAEIDPVERAVLRIACYELEHCPEAPYKVVINEAIELSKKFGATQGHTFINSVLDKAALTFRASEIDQ